jgi:hypothetical protein
MEFNGMSKLVGKSRGKWRRTTGKMVRSGSFVWVSDDWKKVSLEKKERFFEVLMVSEFKFYIAYITYYVKLNKLYTLYKIN